MRGLVVVNFTIPKKDKTGKNRRLREQGRALLREDAGVSLVVNVAVVKTNVAAGTVVGSSSVYC